MHRSINLVKAWSGQGGGQCISQLTWLRPGLAAGRGSLDWPQGGGAWSGLREGGLDWPQGCCTGTLLCEGSGLVNFQSYLHLVMSYRE